MHAGSAEVDESIYHTENCPPLVEQHLGDAPRPLEQPPGEAGGGLIYRGGLALSLKRSDDTVDKRFGQLRTRRRVPSQWRLQAQEDTKRCAGCDAAGPDVHVTSVDRKPGLFEALRRGKPAQRDVRERRKSDFALPVSRLVFGSNQAVLIRTGEPALSGLSPRTAGKLEPDSVGGAWDEGCPASVDVVEEYLLDVAVPGLGTRVTRMENLAGTRGEMTQSLSQLRARRDLGRTQGSNGMWRSVQSQTSRSSPGPRAS